MIFQGLDWDMYICSPEECTGSIMSEHRLKGPYSFYIVNIQGVHTVQRVMRQQFWGCAWLEAMRSLQSSSSGDAY